LLAVNTDRVEIFTALLALIALGGSVLYVSMARWPAGARSTPAGASGGFRFEVVEEVRRIGLWLAWVVAAAATAGSLYFSEVANYVPCQLCWYQRICMYPLAGILLVAAIRRDWSARWYCLPMLVAGVGISSYHYFIEWKPAFGENTCSVGPSCTDIWFRRFGFVTLAFMALCGFIAIAVLLFVEPKRQASTTENTVPQ
jgi:disulfide bond formation protein DsbB